MEIDYQNTPDVAVLALAGRFDARGAMEFDDLLKQTPPAAQAICVDLSEVHYLSSAGIRSLLALLRRLARPELLALVNPCEYVREVLRISAVERLFHIYPHQSAALEELRGRLAGGYREGRGEETTPVGTFTYRTGSEAPTGLDVVGSVADVLHARVTPEALVLRKFSETEYSIGLGAMGGSADDCAPYLGEMITVGGTMVWLPTDGNDTPDFLIPRADSELVGIRTAFNASLVGAFNEYCLFRSADPAGATLEEIYAQLFARAATERGKQAGVMALAMRANLKAAYGSGVTIAPITDFAPPNGEMIIDAKHIKRWFEADTEPRHEDVTALSVGFGVNLQADLSALSKADLDAVFYIHPANVGSKQHLLHNHGVMFEPLPPSADDAALEDVVNQTIESGTFLDMRHLLDTTRTDHALIGISYIAHIRREATG